MPWAPGESGNPDGPRKQKKFLAALERSLAVEDGYKLRSIADKLVECAVSGEPWAIKEIADRLDGKPVQSVAATDAEGRSLVVGLVSISLNAGTGHSVMAPVHSEAVSGSDPIRLTVREEKSSSGLAS